VRQKTAQRARRIEGIGVAEVKEREVDEKEEDRIPVMERGFEGARGIRSTIHRVVALALAWRFATPLPRGGAVVSTHTTHTHTRVHARAHHRVCY